MEETGGVLDDDYCFANRQGGGECISPPPILTARSRTIITLFESTDFATVYVPGLEPVPYGRDKTKVGQYARDRRISWNFLICEGYERLEYYWLRNILKQLEARQRQHKR